MAKAQNRAGELDMALDLLMGDEGWCPATVHLVLALQALAEQGKDVTMSENVLPQVIEDVVAAGIHGHVKGKHDAQDPSACLEPGSIQLTPGHSSPADIMQDAETAKKRGSGCGRRHRLCRIFGAVPAS